MIQIKDGVDVVGLHQVMWEAIYKIKFLFDARNINLVITSALEGEHSWGSRHYTGLAVDLRTRHCSDIENLFNEIKEALQKGYDVVLESTHIHIEYDPKTQEERL